MERKARLYCVGMPKSGTMSLANMFKRSCRSAHEPLRVETQKLIMRVGQMSPVEIKKALIERDLQLRLDVESSHETALLSLWLLQTFTRTKFVLTVRDPFNWLRSFFNASIAAHGTRTDTALKMLDWRFKPHLYPHPPEEDVLKRSGLFSVDCYIHCWKRHNAMIRAVVPKGKLLELPVHQITERAGEIAEFAGLDASDADPKESKINVAKYDHDVMRALDEGYVRERIRRITEDEGSCC